MSQPPSPSGSDLRWLTVGLAADAVDAYAAALGYPDPMRAVDALARAVSVSARGGGPVRAARAARRAPYRLALLVAGGSAAEAGVSAQAKALELSCRRLRYVSYRTADEIAARLAARLERRFGDELRRYELRAIPRGGWLVAGMVAGHLRRPLAPAGTVSTAGSLVVDDCALTGIALRRFAQRLAGRPLIFAPLLAPPSLAREIERQADAVRAVVVGADLAESVEPPGAAHEAWRRAWRERFKEPPYWFGLTESVGFPWNEPKRWVWNPVSETVEPAWRLLAAERCLEGRSGVAFTEPAPRALRLGGEVVAAEVDGVVHIGDLKTGRSWRLEGSGAVLWQALTSHGDRRRAVTEVVELFAVEEPTAASDLDRWLAEMTARGLLEEG